MDTQANRTPSKQAKMTSYSMTRTFPVEAAQPAGKITEQRLSRIAIEAQSSIVMIAGKLLGKHNCLPPGLEDIAPFFVVRQIQSLTRYRTIAVLEVKNEDALCLLADTAQKMGGYELLVYNANGEQDPAFIV